MAHQILEESYRISAIDSDGKQHPADNISGDNAGPKFATCRAVFGVPIENVKSVIVERRGYNKKLTVRDVALKSGQKTEPKVDLVEKK